MRRRSQLKWTVLGAALAAVLMFGMEMTTGGINRVYGPIEGSDPAAVGRFAEAAKAREQLQAAQKYEAELRQLQKKYGVQPSAPAEAQTAFAGDAESSGASSGDVSAWNGYSAGDERYRLPGVAPLDSDTGVNRLADGTAGMLQSVSSSGIRMIVTLFDSFTK
ncbi:MULTISPECIES: hypothetical protein [Paenibacillus]|uniref:hypothetical protein n=1 Tax=Paenibacillus TaxID=44249 RepID=UPI00061EC88A|nr:MULTISPECIES: hypothetical protein [Paenibacillus]KKC47088.1 hypothetical protein VE23_07915 [Paenibacillus sp. D9]